MKTIILIFVLMIICLILGFLLGVRTQMKYHAISLKTGEKE